MGRLINSQKLGQAFCLMSRAGESARASGRRGRGRPARRARATSPLRTWREDSESRSRSTRRAEEREQPQDQPENPIEEGQAARSWLRLQLTFTRTFITRTIDVNPLPPWCNDDAHLSLCDLVDQIDTTLTTLEPPPSGRQRADGLVLQSTTTE